MRPLTRCGLLETLSLVNTLQMKGPTYGLCFALATNQIGLAALGSFPKHSVGSSGVPLRLSRRIGFAIRNSAAKHYHIPLTDWSGHKPPVEGDVGCAALQPDIRLRSVAPTNVLFKLSKWRGGAQ
jgi:hypothetical protein